MPGSELERLTHYGSNSSPKTLDALRKFVRNGDIPIAIGNLRNTGSLAEDVGKIRGTEMQFLMNLIVEEHFPRRETVLLHFSKGDAQIARHWQKSNDAKDAFDDKARFKPSFRGVLQSSSDC